MQIEDLVQLEQVEDDLLALGPVPLEDLEQLFLVLFHEVVLDDLVDILRRGADLLVHVVLVAALEGNVGDVEPRPPEPWPVFRIVV